MSKAIVAATPPVVDINPMVILNNAVSSGASVETLERISALAERWQSNQAREAFNKAMAAAQASMPIIIKSKTNTHTNSQYAPLEIVLDRAKPTLAKHGLTVSFSESDPPRDDWVRVKATVRHINGHSEDYFRDGPMDNLGPKGNPTKSRLHGVASTVTYLSRHLFCGIFAITIAGSDTDGNLGDFALPVTTEQMQELNQLIEQSKTSVERFLKWAEVDSMSELTQATYKAAIPMLRAKIGNPQGGAL